MIDFYRADDSDYVHYLQTCEIDGNTIPITRKPDFFNKIKESAENTTWEVLRDPIGDVVNPRNYVFCKCKVCGFRRNVIYSDLKTGHTRCENCFDNKLKEEAEVYGYSLVGYSNSGPAYRMYKSNICGHTSSIKIEGIRTKRYKCRHCYHDKLLDACRGTTFEPLVDVYSARCTFKAKCNVCGAIEPKNISNVGACQTCVKIKQQEAADKIGCEILERLERSKIVCKLACGHVKTINTTYLQSGVFECKECAKDYLDSFATPLGITVHHGNYGKHHSILCTLPCGCNKHVHREELYRGRVYCKIHGDSHFNSKRFLYLLRIEQDAHEWLKLGIAIDIDRRIRGYKLNENAVATLVHSVEFETGYLAIEKEAKLHTKFKLLNLDNNLMKSYMKSGWSECYPLEAQDLIIQHMEELCG